MAEESLKCVKCDKTLILNKDEITECNRCHNKYCYDCSLDYMVWYDTAKLCKECALGKPANWLKQMDIHKNKTNEPLK